MRGLHIHVVAALLGLATFLIAYGGLGHLFGTNAHWGFAQQDERMALIGYRYFLYEPWHWPVFVSHAVNVPYPKSVAFLDCIPIWALVNILRWITRRGGRSSTRIARCSSCPRTAA